jgi:hypothetical protein
MKLTNKSGLPEALVRALENDSYTAGDSDFTATSLIKPSRLWALEKLHAHEIEEDAEDGLYRLYGQVAHGILERANLADLAEKRFFSEFSGKRVSAQLDSLSLTDGVLSDFKFTTSWGFKQDTPPKPEWVAQLNIQLELLRRNGLDANSLQIIGLLRDWQIREARFNPGYPQAPVATLAIPMWSREQTASYIEMRIASHLAALKALPLCSVSERWAKPDQWAVVKGKRAINGGVQLSQELAEAICAKSPGTRVEYRPGESTRCESYCAVSQFCTQFKRQSANTLADEGEKDAI